jgi:hypothetical protein
MRISLNNNEQKRKKLIQPWVSLLVNFFNSLFKLIYLFKRIITKVLSKKIRNFRSEKNKTAKIEEKYQQLFEKATVISG